MSLGLQGIPGRNLLPYRSGYGAKVKDGSCSWMQATLDWNLFATAGSNLVLPDTETIFSGWRYARYGQVLCRVTGSGGPTLTIGGGATGGTFTISVTDPVEGSSQTNTTAGIAFGASASVVQTALEALLNVGLGNVTVFGVPGGPYTFVFAQTLGAVTITSSAASLTGGTPTATVAAGTAGNPGFFGPYDPAASDGRQTLSAGNCGIVDATIVMGGSLQLPLQDDLHTSLIVGGRVWRDKIIQSGVGTHSLAAGPTLAELIAVLGIQPVFV